MDHAVVARQKMAERYLLDELEPEVRDEFEEHFFDCPVCAQDMCAGADFVQHSKIVLAEKTAPVPIRTHASAPAKPVGSGGLTSGWFAWFRPAFAMPVMALLLAVIGYQNLVMFPNSNARAHVLPWASITAGTWGVTGTSIAVPEKSGFLLFVRIPQSGPYTGYIADLYNPQGKLEWSLPLQATPGQDEWSIQIPAGNREAGTYRLSVHGTTTTGESKDLGSASFELQIQK